VIQKQGKWSIVSRNSLRILNQNL